MVQVFRCGASWGAYPLVSVLPAADVSHLAAGVEKQRRQPSELCAAATEAAARWIIATESTDISLSVGCFYFAMKLFLRHYILPLRRKIDVVRLRDCRAVSAVISASARRHHDDMSSSAGDTLTLTSEDPNYHFNTIQDSRNCVVYHIMTEDYLQRARTTRQTFTSNRLAEKSHNREWKSSCKLSFAGLGAAERAVTGCEESSVLQTSFLSECWVYAVLVIWSCMFEDQ